jgi:hypothetical protein
MQCPKCLYRFGFLDSMRIWRPFRHKCPGCGALLTTGLGGGLALAGSVVVGLLVAGISYYMEGIGASDFRHSLWWYAASVLAAAPALQWLAWRGLRFTVREEKAATSSSGSDR